MLSTAVNLTNVLALKKPTKWQWTPALLGVVLFVLRYWAKKKASTKSGKDQDHSDIGRRIVNDGLNDYEEDEYDIIIVGGGTGGCVLASRLSEDPAIRVLLLEAGDNLSEDPITQIPAAASALMRSEHDYNLYTENQPRASGRNFFWPRAKLLGGCTNINAMIFQCGHPTDYDEWANLQRDQPGASGWSYKEFQQYFRKFEKYNPSKLYPKVDASRRGSTGEINVGHFGHFSKHSAAFVEACVAAGIQKKHDLNTADGTMGASPVLSYMDSNGRRVTAARAYLTPAVLARPNLRIATKASVTKILFDDENEIPRAVGVEFANGEGARFRAKASKEVVLAAGAIHTPQILMLSGIGSAEHLSTHNIPVVADLPGVGSGLKDHLVLDLFYLDKTNTSLMYLSPRSIFDQVALQKAIMQYAFFKTGPLTTNVAEALTFVHSSDPKLFPPSQFPRQLEDNSSGDDAPDIELFVSPMAYVGHGEPFYFSGDYFSLHAVMLRPQSSGEIRLKSSNPFDAPLIDPQYFSEPNDMNVLIRAVRLAARIGRTEPLRAIVDPEGDSVSVLHHNIDKRTDEQIAEDIRRRCETLYHPCCSARMAPIEDDGVVDPYLKVHNVEGLRIADASVFPEIISGHTAGPVIAIAEKAADLIKSSLRERR